MDSNSHHRPAGLSLTGKPGESRQSIASKSSFTRTLDSLQNFIGLLTTVHFFSVLTTFATYFGVIQSDWHVSPLYFLVGNGSAAQHTRQSHPTSQLCKVRHHVFSPSSWTITCLCCAPLTEHSGNIDKLEKKGFHSLGLGWLYSGNCFPYYVRLAKSTMFVPVCCQRGPRVGLNIKHFLVS